MIINNNIDDINTREELQIIKLTGRVAEIRDEASRHAITLAFIFDVTFAFIYITAAYSVGQGGF